MSVSADFTPLVNAAATSATTIAETSLLAALAVLSISIAVVCVFVVLRQAKECHEGTKTVVNNNTKAVQDLKDSNRESMNDIKIALVELKAEMKHTVRG